MAKILIVEDDSDVANALRRSLEVHHRVEVCLDGETAIDKLTSSNFDVLLIDWTLPGISGLEVLKRYRKNGGHSPILFLTGKNDLAHKEIGFAAGVDDYVTKPFDLREIDLRVMALLRRHKSISEDILRVRDLELDSKARKLKRGGCTIMIAPREFELLEFLMRNPHSTFPAEELAKSVWPTDSTCTAETVRSYIRKLRDHIDQPDKRSYIANARGHGYAIEREESV